MEQQSSEPRLEYGRSEHTAQAAAARRSKEVSGNQGTETHGGIHPRLCSFKVSAVGAPRRSARNALRNAWRVSPIESAADKP